MANTPISVRLDEELLAEIDSEAEKLGRSRNWIIGMRLKNSRTKPPLYRINKGGDLEIIPEVGYGVSGAGVEGVKKIADDMVGGVGAEGGGDPCLPPVGKAQDEPFIYGRAGDTSNFGAVTIPKQAHEIILKPRGQGISTEALRISKLTESVSPETSHPTYSRIGRNRWSEKLLRELADSKSEPDGMKHLSSESLEEIKEHAKTDGGAAALLHLAGVELDREILVRWGLAENYKPKMGGNKIGNEKSVEASAGNEEEAATGKDRRYPEVLPQDDDGGKSAAVGVGKSEVGNAEKENLSKVRKSDAPDADGETVLQEVRKGVNMAALRDICAGKGIHPVPLSVEPVEVDLCGFKSYNEIDGENYVCGKEVHGPKVDHGEWIKI
jgi:hypothetical protein